MMVVLGAECGEGYPVKSVAVEQDDKGRKRALRCACGYTAKITGKRGVKEATRLVQQHVEDSTEPGGRCAFPGEWLEQARCN